MSGRPRYSPMSALPRDQVKASVVEGRSKYRMALLSTRRRAGKIIDQQIQGSHLEKRRHTTAMHDTRRLLHCLHSKDGPQVNRPRRVFPSTGVLAQDQKVIAQDGYERSWGDFRCKALHRNQRLFSTGIDHLKVVRYLANDPRELQTTVHDKPTVGLYEWAREFSTDTRLPVDKLASRLGLSLPFIHVGSKHCYFIKRTLQYVVHCVGRRGCRAHQFFKLSQGSEEAK